MRNLILTAITFASAATCSAGLIATVEKVQSSDPTKDVHNLRVLSVPEAPGWFAPGQSIGIILDGASISHETYGVPDAKSFWEVIDTNGNETPDTLSAIIPTIQASFVRAGSPGSTHLVASPAGTFAEPNPWASGISQWTIHAVSSGDPGLFLGPGLRILQLVTTAGAGLRFEVDIHTEIGYEVGHISLDIPPGPDVGSPLFTEPGQKATINIFDAPAINIAFLDGFAVDDVIGRPVSLSSTTIPDFLKFSHQFPVGQNYYSFALNRPLTLADVGLYEVELTVSDGTRTTHSTVQFQIIVPEPVTMLSAGAFTVFSFTRHRRSTQ